ncbi:uncharacterized protein LOC144707202 isoform X2 [Wolffia australiana]
MGKKMEGIASIALLPCGSISGHFIRLEDSSCYGLHGTGKMQNKREKVVVIEYRGHDAAKFRSIHCVHGWGEEAAEEVEKANQGKQNISISFDCETLKADAAAEDHVRRFMPKLSGHDVVVNVGPMTISGFDFQVEEPNEVQTS